MMVAVPTYSDIDRMQDFPERLRRQGKLVIAQMDENYGPNWRFSIFSVEKAVRQLQEAGSLIMPEYGDEWGQTLGALQRIVQLERERRKNAPQSGPQQSTPCA